MYGDEHYLSKIERNFHVLDKAPYEVRNDAYNHIVWARELSKRLEMLDYQEREQAISNIHKVLDNDYALMGFEIEKTEGLSR